MKLAVALLLAWPCVAIILAPFVGAWLRRCDHAWAEPESLLAPAPDRPTLWLPLPILAPRRPHVPHEEETR
jgi:hypothetical protein